MTEIRVPGFGGTNGRSLLDVTDTVNVAGDTVGELVRPADRLHRPAPGPVLRALGGAVPRTLEGYRWSGMTTGGAAKTSWVLLFPFTLANVASWMLPPDPGTRGARILASCCRALARLAALLLTMLLVTQLAVITLDLFAAQCLDPGTPCLASAPSWLEAAPTRGIIGLLPLVISLGLLYRVSGARWGTHAPDTASGTKPDTPGARLREPAGVPVLRRAHLVGPLAALTVLLCGGPLALPRPTGELVLWSCGIALLGLCGLATLVPPAGRVAIAVSRVLVALACGVALAATVVAAPLGADAAADGLPGTDGTVEGLAGLLVMVCAVFAAVLVPGALLARRGWQERPKRLRPWAGGWAAAPTLILACLLGGGFGAGAAVAVRWLVGDSSLRLPESYTLITMLWGAALAAAALLAVAGFAVAVPIRRLRRGIPAIVHLLHPRDDQDISAGPAHSSRSSTRETAAAAWARAGWERHWLHRLVLAFVGFMSAGAVVLLIGRYALHAIPSELRALSGVGVVTLGLFAVGLVRVILSAARGGGGRRHLGAFADLVSFWPRAAHPAVPPCYALKVIPELTERARQHLAEPDTRVVLTGYQIGGLLAAIATGELLHSATEQERERIGLVTAGCPLQWGYQRAFPAVFPVESLAELYGTLDGRWRGLCRGTDAFGGGATTWRHQVLDNTMLGLGFHTDGGTGALPVGRQGPTGAVVLGGDHWLPDPMHGPRVGHRWAPGVRRNSDYVCDPEWDRAISMAAGLLRTDATATPQAEHSSLPTDLSGIAGHARSHADAWSDPSPEPAGDQRPETPSTTAPTGAETD